VLIQLYVLRQLLLSLAFSVGGLGVIVLPTIAIQAVNKLGAISVGTVVEYLPLVIAELVPYLGPLSFLLAVVATYGRLAADRELIAIQMAGIHPARLILPGLAVSLALAFGTDRLLGEYSPVLKFQQRTQVAEAEYSRFLAGMRGRNVLAFGGNVLHGEVTPDGAWRNSQLEIEHEGKLVKIIAAETRIDVEGDLLVVRMKDARFLTEDKSGYQAQLTRFWRLDELFPPQVRDRTKARYLRSSELREALDQGPDPEQRSGMVYEIHRRHALAVTYVLFLLLGIPTGLTLRSSTQLGAFTGAIGYAFVYYVLALRLGKVLAEAGAVPSVVAAWATNGLFLLVGLVFLARVLFR